jgi:hypothetical protein
MQRLTHTEQSLNTHPARLVAQVQPHLPCLTGVPGAARIQNALRAAPWLPSLWHAHPHDAAPELRSSYLPQTSAQQRNAVSKHARADANGAHDLLMLQANASLGMMRVQAVESPATGRPTDLHLRDAAPVSLQQAARQYEDATS